MDTGSSLANVIEELELRHNELLERLDELDQRVAQTLNEWTGKQETIARNVSEGL